MVDKIELENLEGDRSVKMLISSRSYLIICIVKIFENTKDLLEQNS